MLRFRRQQQQQHHHHHQQQQLPSLLITDKLLDHPTATATAANKKKKSGDDESVNHKFFRLRIADPLLPAQRSLFGAPQDGEVDQYIDQVLFQLDEQSKSPLGLSKSQPFSYCSETRRIHTSCDSADGDGDGIDGENNNNNNSNNIDDYNSCCSSSEPPTPPTTMATEGLWSLPLSDDDLLFHTKLTTAAATPRFEKEPPPAPRKPVSATNEFEEKKMKKI